MGGRARGEGGPPVEGTAIMTATLPFVSPLLLLHENPEAVLAALRDGWVDHLGLADDQVTDEHVGYALRSGLLAECAAAFPDPRCEPEIPIQVLLTAGCPLGGSRAPSRGSMPSPGRGARSTPRCCWRSWGSMPPGCSRARASPAGVPRAKPSSMATCCASCCCRSRLSTARPGACRDRACWTGGTRAWDRRFCAWWAGEPAPGSGMSRS